MKRLRTHHLAAALAVLSLAVLAPADAMAQGESLTWDSIHVRARLDEDARLHVREHQSMVFDGAWNGGERELEPRLGQKVNLEGIWRMDTGTGELIPLDQEDDAERVDTYDQDGSTVRWRSRDPDDPPFSHERLDYVLEYSVTNAVIPRPDGYLLDYDFLFTDRDGPVDRFTLELELADAWTPQAQVQSRWDAVAIPPGNGFKLEIPLTYADGRPATVLPPTSPLLRYLAMGILVLGAALLLRRLNTREREAGRFRPLPEVEGDDWLEANVFRMSPELVGAAWDRSTGADEVAGLLARLVQEGKLSSRTEPGSGLGKQPVLHLALKVPRTDFRGYERELIDALFFDDRTETDTESIKEHYESSGFHPGQIIGPELKRKVDALAGGGRVSRSWRAALILLGAGGALFVAAGILRPADLLPGVVAVAFLGVAGVIATTTAASYARRVTGLRAPLIAMFVLAGITLLGLVWFMAGGLETSASGAATLSPYYRPGGVFLLSLAVLGLGIIALMVEAARPTDTPGRLDLRRRMAAAQAYFQEQLERSDPDLRDEWFPYILAFGLGTHVDRWFKAYGASVAGTAAAHTAIHSGAAASSSSSWTGGGPTFGGGGGFSGGGAGASWGAAAGGIASGVSAPSSGGTSGGASAGGGGGGGW